MGGGGGLCPHKNKGEGAEALPLPQHPRFRRLGICCTTMKRPLSLNHETLFSLICFLFSPFSFFFLVAVFVANIGVRLV